MQIAVAKMQLDAIAKEGQDTLALIESSKPQGGAAGAPANAAAGVGERVNIVA
jgi:hypothetical protein